MRPHNSGGLAVLSVYLAYACPFVVDCTSVQYVELKVSSLEALILLQQVVVVVVVV